MYEDWLFKPVDTISTIGDRCSRQVYKPLRSYCLHGR